MVVKERIISLRLYEKERKYPELMKEMGISTQLVGKNCDDEKKDESITEKNTDARRKDKYYVKSIEK